MDLSLIGEPKYFRQDENGQWWTVVGQRDDGRELWAQCDEPEGELDRIESGYGR